MSKKTELVKAFVLNGKRKTAIVLTSWFCETTANNKEFTLPSERSLRTGKPDGHINEGSTTNLFCKAVADSKPFLVNGRVNFPDWSGKILSVNRRRFTIVETTFEEHRGFIKAEIKAVRHTYDFKIIHYR